MDQVVTNLVQQHHNTYVHDLVSNTIFFVVSGTATGFFIANAVYYGKIKNNGCAGISKGEANAMVWINAILAVIFGLIFLYTIYRYYQIHKRDVQVHQSEIEAQAVKVSQTTAKKQT